MDRAYRNKLDNRTAGKEEAESETALLNNPYGV